MSASPRRVSLSGHVVDLDRHELLTPTGEAVDLRRQALDLLVHLARHAGRVVAKEELLAQVWPGMVVTDDSLVQAVGDARRAIGDEAHRTIQTVPRRGYRLIADERELTAADAAPAAARTETRETGPVASADKPWWRRWMIATALLLVVAGTLAAWQPWRGNGASHPVAAAPAPDLPPIAVLDFAEADASLDDRLMARAFSEELTSELSRNADLRVIASHSSFAAMEGADTPARVGERLGAGYLVAGSVRREGETLRLGVQLLEGPTGQVVWSERKSVGAADVYVVRNALLERIAGSLHSVVRSSEKAHVLERPPASLDIYAMALRGRALKHRFTAKDSAEATALLERVVALDPQYAAGWAYLGMVNATDAIFQYNGPFTAERMNRAIAQMEHSIELNDRLTAGYFGLSFSYQFVGRYEDGVRAGRRCVELGPSDADCLNFYAAALLWVGRAAEALPYSRRSMEMNPLAPTYALFHHGAVLWANGLLTEALSAMDDCVRQSPGHNLARVYRILSLVELGRLDEARADVAAIRRSGNRMLPAETLAGWGWDPRAKTLIQRRLDGLRKAGWPSEQAVAAGR